MTPYSESSPPASVEAKTPFASLYPILRGVNQAIYSFWKIPLPVPEPLIDSRVDVIPPPASPETVAEGDRRAEPKAQPEAVNRQMPQRIARLGKMRWSKPKATHCAGRRKLKRGQGS